ncbi:hypothetical protein AB0K51_30745 [Kitasatospora sp. NPDC049285]|uniref:hypothetical protein n=1 Tax=Kitasatospora sp. NPDC049285 TaxID=3157096 RepID=UPI003415F6C8
MGSRVVPVAPGILIRSGEMHLGDHPWQPEYAAYFLTGQCDGIVIGDGDLSWLPTVPGLKRLRLMNGTGALAPIADCTSLTLLRLPLQGRRGGFDFSRLAALEELETPVLPGFETLRPLTSLRELTVVHWRDLALAEIGPKPNLTFLRIACVRGRGLSLAGAGHVPDLDLLWIEDGVLTDTDRLCEADQLTEVRLVGAKTSTVDFASGLPRLRSLLLENCGPIDSLAPLAGHPTLRQVTICGSTVVADGDLSPLLDPHLTHVTLERRAPHYSHRPAEVRRG